MSFVVYSLPRSRSFWLSKFLTYGDWLCSHDETNHFRSLDDVRSWLGRANTGSVETTASPFWRLIPDVKTVVLRRPVNEVVDSLEKLGMVQNREAVRAVIQRYDRKLDQICHRVPNVLSVTFEELKEEATCKKVFEHVLPYEHDHGWWSSMADVNLQMNMKHGLSYFEAYEPQLTKLAKIAKHTILANMPHKEIDKDDGLVIQEESFEKWEEDARASLSEHLMLIGDAPDSGPERNYPLFRQLHDAGNLQIMTARCNGRVFGYLWAVITPSIESRNNLIGIHTVFYASPEFKGLGLKLQRASIEALRAKGIEEVHFYAGVRGSGPRIASLYKRLGAVCNGELYKLALNP